MENSAPGLPDQMRQAVEKLYEAASTEQELGALDGLRDFLLPEGATHEQLQVPSTEDDDLEQEWLAFAQLQDPAEDENPFPGCQLESLLLDQYELDHFVHYLFERRYGWSERGSELQAARRGPQAEARNKIHINDHLDAFIKWFHWHSISLQLLASLTSCIKQAVSKPVVRNQTVIHAMDWLQRHAASMAEAHYKPAKNLILLGLTDVWSAIRSACVARLSHVLELFSVIQIKDFFNELAGISQSSESSWQAKEGAVMGVNSIVRHFQWVSQITVDEADEDRALEDTMEDTLSLQQTQYFLRFGHHEFRGMPDFIESQMRMVIFPLLAHPQTSIREHATRAFASFLGRCEFKGALSSFQEVICRLCRGTGVSEDLEDYTVLPHMALLRGDYTFLDAYEAEGLLGLTIFLVKHIPPSHLLPSWPLYFSTFSLYLSHPASTVRQATSSIFKFLVARDSHSPVILKLVLQGLGSSWVVDTTQLAEPLRSPPEVPSSKSNTNALSEPLNILPGYGQRISITKIAASSECPVLSDAWEWREGRLLAYELILTFLVKNHCLYTFGPPNAGCAWGVPGLGQASPRPPAIATAGSSADQAFFAGREREESAASHSRSYGGYSLHAGLTRTASDKLPRQTVGPLSSSPLNTSVTLVISPAEESPSCEQELEEPRLRTAPDSSGSSASYICSPLLKAPDESYCPGGGCLRAGSPAGGGPGHGPRSVRRGRYSICVSSPSHHLPVHLRRRQAWAQNNWVSQANIGSSDASVLRHITRRPSSVGDTGPSQRTLVRHYSFFAEKADAASGSSKAGIPTPSVIPGNESLNRAFSLLMHTLATDLQEEQKAKSLQPRVTNEAASRLRRPSLGEAMDAQCDWLKKVELQSLATILESLLYQTIESLADVQWELRRMGQQLLPCVAEVLRWYDIAVLEMLWCHHLVPETSTLTYGASLTLKYSLAHALKLLPMVHSVPPSWQDPEMCRQVALRITDCIQRGLAGWLRILLQLLQRPTIDKLSVVATEIIMQAHGHFTIPDEEKDEQTAVLVQLLLQIFCLAHPGSQLATQLKTKAGHPIRKVIPLEESYLSCCTRKAGVQQNAQQAERYILDGLHSILVAFLQSSRVTLTSSLLPLLAAYVSIYAQNDTFHKTVLDSVAALGAACQGYLDSCPDSIQATKLQIDCVSGLRELSTAVTLKTLEAPLMRQVLDVYAIIARHVEPHLHLPYLLRAVCSRSSPGSSQVKPSLATYLGQSHGPDTDLTLLSNNIPFTPSPPPDVPSDSDEEENNDLLLDGIQESHLLDTSATSSNPGHHAGSGDGHGVSPLPDTSDGGSDWDSWSDEEDEDDSAVTSIIGEFLHRLQDQELKTGTAASFKSVFAQLSVSDQCVIDSLMATT